MKDSPEQDDRDEAELERRDAEGLAEHRDNPRARVDLALDVGRVEHTLWENETRRQELAAGRIEGEHFGIEHRMEHPDGSWVRFDYVDFERDVIVDRKAVARGDTVADLTMRHAEQFERYQDAYEANRGVRPTIELSPYPSTRDLGGK